MSVLIYLIILLTGCNQAASEHPGSPHRITVSYTNQPQSALIHIAVSKGYFSEEHLDVQPLLFTYGKASLQSLIDHKSDFAAVAETPVMFKILEGEKIYVIANIESTNINNAIIARKDSGISEPHDLIGKKVGFTPGTTSDFFLDSFLTANNLMRRQIKPIPLLPDEMLDAILAKRVDAVSTWNYPLTQISKTLGDNKSTFFDKDIYTETFNIVSQQDFVRTNPETVKQFLRAILKAESFVEHNPDEAQSIMSTNTNVDKAIIKEVWNSFKYKVLLGRALLITLEDETRWAMDNKLAIRKPMPEYINFIYIDGLKALKPEAVKIQR